MVGVGRNAAATNLEYKYYFTNLKTPNYQGKNSVLVKLKLVDGDNATIVNEQIRVIPNFRFDHTKGSSGSKDVDFNEIFLLNVIPLTGYGKSLHSCLLILKLN